MTTEITINRNDFAVQVNSYRYMLTRLAYKYIKNDAKAEDLASETIYQALTKMDMYKEGTNLKAWLCTCLKNAAINSIRAEKRRPMRYIDSFPDLSDHAYNDEMERACNDVKEAMKKLPPCEYKTLFKVFEGQTPNEIAKSRGVSHITIRVQLFEAKKSLKNMFAAKSFEYEF